MEVEVTFVLPRQAMDLSGQRFGRLLAIKPIGKKGAYILWHCRCDCGADVQVRSGHLRDGSTNSCGCWRREQIASVSIRHGGWQSRAYHIYRGILRRCNKPQDKGYKNYGGRGIKLDPLWQESFAAFLEHVSILPGFGDPTLTLDRIDNDKNYEPGNVRWASSAQQRRNSRQNLMLTHNGLTRCVGDWERQLGFSQGVVGNRLKRGWTIDKALSTPLQIHRRRNQNAHS